jgi:hypothetical protein
MARSRSVIFSLESSIDGLGDTGEARVLTLNRFAQTHQPVFSLNRNLSRHFEKLVKTKRCPITGAVDRKTAAFDHA